MKLHINGEQKDIDVQTIQHVIDSFELKNVVVEHNKNIVKKESFQTTKLKENDVLEIVSLVGGG